MEGGRLIEILTLGAVEVIDAEKAAPIRLEPKRLALLIYIALAHDGRPVSRDALFPVFWPELDEQRARNALRQALHYLARRLGPVLEGRGMHEIGIDPLRVDCDVFRFERALDAGVTAPAMASYRGEFLPGLFFRNSPDPFLEWVGRERSRLSERVLNAAIELARAEARRANVAGEIHWLKRALEIEPFREDLIERIVDRYELLGNRATAIHAIRAYSRELRLQYGVPLSPRLRLRLQALQDAGPSAARMDPSHRRLHELQVQVATEVSRTNDLIRQLQKLTPRRRTETSIDQADGRGIFAPGADLAEGQSMMNPDPVPGPTLRDSLARYRVVALAASAGGIHALGHVLAGLDPTFPASILIVLHLDPHYPSHLSEILGRRTTIPVEEAREGVEIVPGHAYVGPPNHHLLANADGTLSLTKTEFVHFVRPSADLLFDSVAACYGKRAIAVILTGSGVDGAKGVCAIHERGGVVLVQNEDSSEFFGMPSAAIQTGSVDHVLPLQEIGPALRDLVEGSIAA